ncbi:Oxidoreductase, molybdopterin-binding domain-containing protein [Gigaspora rosea]|uniref:Oxidoreductase, molybdopterin-binding domain-containing protein n=1 Tax=Gigaspora rosea TaxID=44941 RepID=A0A397VIR2_9GLOM|nr:Oxidoreductase, molybdopterin-binding domain-containing protein [Gigaspora rosea]
MATNITNTNSIDPCDVGTPDDWISRHPEMVHLSKKYPFNAESPLSLLIDQGFITPNPLYYVRNHGPVPKLHWDTHRLIVDGYDDLFLLILKPLNLSMNNIEKFPYKKFSVTLVCAGNRKKELNMIKQSKESNWDSAAVKWCLNDINDIILAYKMNCERLPPNHSYPLRVIIPGYIGGRIVKWLSRITISNKESNSYYHYHDNRVLPSEYNVDQANKKNIWYNPNYIINYLNINSVITSSAYNEYILLLNFFNNNNNQMYNLKGYAYTDSGNKITHVEISLDDGKTWILAKLNQPELDHPVVLKRGINPIPRYWCWSFWSLTIPLYSFIRCEEISVRAWDATQNTQPRNPTWNVLGMMNNSHFRVKINTIVQGSEFHLIFEHPIQPGNLSGECNDVNTSITTSCSVLEISDS